MSLKVIGAGFPRTGTSSLKNSLERLGFEKCYHMKELIVNPEMLKFWKEIDETGKTDWDALFENYQACVDVPGYPYYKIMMERYPDAKVILTKRPFEDWYRSASTTVRKAGPQTVPEKLGMLFKLATNSRTRKVVAAIKFFEKIFWEKQFKGRFNDKKYAERVFNQHIQEVIDHVPAEKLLVYEVKDGWKPLCDFLDCPLPEGDFPHLNKGENFKEMLGELMEGNMV